MEIGRITWAIITTPSSRTPENLLWVRFKKTSLSDYFGTLLIRIIRITLDLSGLRKPPFKKFYILRAAPLQKAFLLQILSK